MDQEKELHNIKENDAILIVQVSQQRDVAELRRDGAR